MFFFLISLLYREYRHLAPSTTIGIINVILMKFYKSNEWLCIYEKFNNEKMYKYIHIYVLKHKKFIESEYNLYNLICQK